MAVISLQGMQLSEWKNASVGCPALSRALQLLLGQLGRRDGFYLRLLLHQQDDDGQDQQARDHQQLRLSGEMGMALLGCFLGHGMCDQPPRQAKQM